MASQQRATALNWAGRLPVVSARIERRRPAIDYLTSADRLAAGQKRGARET